MIVLMIFAFTQLVYAEENVEYNRYNVEVDGTDTICVLFINHDKQRFQLKAYYDVSKAKIFDCRCTNEFSLPGINSYKCACTPDLISHFLWYPLGSNIQTCKHFIKKFFENQ